MGLKPRQCQTTLARLTQSVRDPEYISEVSIVPLTFRFDDSSHHEIFFIGSPN